MKTKNALIRLVLVLVYRIGFGDVCGFRFWANFLAVLRFWTIFSSVLRFLLHPNAPLKQPCHKSGLCCFSFARYSQKCFTQFYRALYRDAMFVPFGRTQTCFCNVTKASVFKFCYITLELQRIEINASSRASTI